ncbi:MAG: hypothetical protein N2560_06025 [Ignavibacteria bacterium]|nr:hypothetical protein [Ignavibacteria bacterium]
MNYSLKRQIIAFLFLVPSFLLSQEVKVETKIDTNKILIGDHISLNLLVRSKPPTEVIFPELKDSLGKFEIIEIGKTDTSLINDELVLKKKIKLTIFDSGYYYIPSLNILYLKKGVNQFANISTDSFPIFVKGIEVDTTKDIKDIKDIAEIPYTIWDFIPYVLILVGIAVFAYFIYFFIRRRKRKPELAEELKLPPHIVALQELKQLDSEKLWQKGEIKQFHIRLTEIIRKYIERRFEIPALEMISREIIDNLFKINNLEAELIEKLRRSFEISDLVKFAKFVPLPDDHTFCLKVAFEFVESTIPKVDVEQEPQSK